MNNYFKDYWSLPNFVDKYIEADKLAKESVTKAEKWLQDNNVKNIKSAWSPYGFCGCIINFEDGTSIHLKHKSSLEFLMEKGK